MHTISLSHRATATTTMNVRYTGDYWPLALIFQSTKHSVAKASKPRQSHGIAQGTAFFFLPLYQPTAHSKGPKNNNSDNKCIRKDILVILNCEI